MELAEPLSVRLRKIKQTALQAKERGDWSSDVKAVAAACVRTALFQQMPQSSVLVSKEEEARFRHELRTLNLPDPEFRELMLSTASVASWCGKDHLLRLPFRPCDIKRLRECAKKLRRLLDDPFCNPALATGDFVSRPFWRLPELLDEQARVLQAVQKLPRKQVYREALLLTYADDYSRIMAPFQRPCDHETFSYWCEDPDGTLREHSRTIGRFEPARAKRLLEIFGYTNISQNALTQAIKRARTRLFPINPPLQ